MIEISHLSVKFPNARDYALNDVSTTFKQGEFICILGKSGAGKSTFIRCINGLQRPTSGNISWDGKVISEYNDQQLRKVRREMGMIFQHFNLIPRMSVLQNVLTGTFGARNPFKNLIGVFTKEERERALQAIAEVELTNYASRRVELLSGGQKQRVGIARALVQEPRVFLGDEPVASLDPGTSSKIFQLLQRFHQERGLITIINVHDVMIAKQFATRILALKNGKLLFDGKPTELSDEMLLTIYDMEAKEIRMASV